MSFLTKVQRAFHAYRTTPDLDNVKRTLDLIQKEGDSAIVLADVNKQASKKSPSQLDIRDTTRDLLSYYAYGFVRNWCGDHGQKIPIYGDYSRDEYLSNIWQAEPILAGAVYSMTAKMTALKWSVTGKRLQAQEAAQIFSNAEHMDGHDWGAFISSVAQQFYLTDRGTYVETARGATGYGRNITRMVGNLAAIGHIDSLCCWQTGNREVPMVYYSDMTGQTIRFKPGEYFHFASLPSARERYLGIGFCAVSRALRAANLLMGLHDYDDEKLSNLPPEGVAAVTGLTMDELKDAFTLWKAARERDSSLTYPQVLWLLSSQPNAEVSVNFTAFSQIPESFDRKSVVDQYVATLAMCFGVDAREFWPMSSGALGSAGESEIQHMKAKGKGPGEFISIMERHLNAELPEGTTFAFDTQDIEEDQMAAMVAKSWIDALWPLYQGIPNPKASPPLAQLGGSGTPSTPGNLAGQQPGQPAGARPKTVQTKPAIMRGKQAPGEGQPQTEQVISKDDFLRLLIDHGVLPEWLANDSRTMIADTDVHLAKESHDEVMKYVWDKGVLYPTRLPAIVLGSATTYDLPFALLEQKDYSDKLEILKQKEEQITGQARNIKGSPIPDKEAKRVANVTETTIRDENALWRNNPILSKFAMTDTELDKFLGIKKSVKKELHEATTRIIEPMVIENIIPTKIHFKHVSGPEDFDVKYDKDGRIIGIGNCIVVVRDSNGKMIRLERK